MRKRRPFVFAGLAVWLVAAVWCAAGATASAAGTEGWGALWTREPGKGVSAADEKVPGGRPPVVRVEHTGERDWSLSRPERVSAAEGDLFVLTGRARVQGAGSATLGVILYDARGEVVEWVYGGSTVRSADAWQPMRSRFVVPPGVTAFLPRFIGNGPATVWFDSFGLRKEGNVEALRNGKDLPAELTLASETLRVTLHTKDATFSVLDRRTNRTWRQAPQSRGFVITRAEGGDRLTLDWIEAASGLEGRVVLALDPQRPELAVTLSADGDLPSVMAFPAPFLAEPPAYLVVPMNEGISYPVDDASIGSMRLVTYGGHGICMPFWGVTDGGAGHMAIFETPDDAAILLTRVDGRLVVAPEWHPQKGRFGYPRRIRYVFLDAGGHVAIAKRYRAYAKQVGLLKTLAEKRKEVPAVDRLIGAVNVWNWDRDGVSTVKDLQGAGIHRILWSHRQPPQALEALNAMDGVLTSRYDIVQDVMDPAQFPRLGGVHADWPTEAWPKDLMIGADGQWTRGWQVRAKDGEMIPCGTLCDRQAPPYLDRRMTAELKDHPYRCRFIDTTTASPWRECYHADHPMTRSESRRFKMDLLALVSGKHGLVCGSETGHDAAVPYVHYFEGMMSLGPYRVPEAGRNMMRVLDEVPERVAKFQVGHRYRLPLWELVYHDCVVAQWYWGDYNNKLPALWDKRDLFNVLYGTPPMFMFNRQGWRANRDRFARSYRTVCPVVRAVGYAEMTDHRFLTPDRDVQQTVIAGGVAVTVNFGETPFRLPDGTEVGPMAHHVTGLAP